VAQRFALLTSLGVLLAATALVLTDSFYGALHVRPQDAGVSDLDVMARGVVYLGLAVGLAGVAATAALFGTRALLARVLPGVSGTVAWGATVTVAAAAAWVTGVLVFGGFGRFATASTSHLVASALVALALTGLVALFEAASVPATGVLAPRLAWLMLAAFVIGGPSALLLARSAGHELADDARQMRPVTPGPFDPMQIRATPACILPSAAGAGQDTGPAKLWMEVGQSSAGVALYDPDTERGILVAPIRLGALGVAGDVCRVPGEPVPVEVGSPQEDAALARLYRPVLRFDSREPWRPLNAEHFFSETFADEPVHHRVCSRSGACEDLRSGAQLSDDAATIDIRGTRDDGADYTGPGTAGCRPAAPRLECPDPTSAIYYHVERRDRRAYVDYWWFLRYDHVPDPSRSGGTCAGPPLPLGLNRKFEHEGDWEGITAVSQFGRPERLDHVAYSAHGFAVRYPRAMTVLSPSEQRAEVDVACGTHAAYPQRCLGPKSCRETAVRCSGPPCHTTLSKIAEAAFDGAAPWERNADEACFTTAPCLLPLPAADADNPSPWTTWPGHWGRDTHAPASPGRQARYRRPWDSTPSNRTTFGRQASAGLRPSPSSAPEAPVP
jgi:hypothetical protein